MRIAICDDEKVFAENILRKLKFEFGKRSQECSFVTVNRGEELLDICSKEKIDVVFLDIITPYGLFPKIRCNLLNRLLIKL